MTVNLFVFIACFLFVVLLELISADDKDLNIIGYFEVFTVSKLPDGTHHVSIDKIQQEYLEAFLMAVEDANLRFKKKGYNLKPVVYAGENKYAEAVVNVEFNGAIGAYELHNAKSHFPVINCGNSLGLETFSKVSNTINM